MGNPEKLTIQGTQDNEKQEHNTTRYMREYQYCKQTNTNNVNKI